MGERRRPETGHQSVHQVLVGRMVRMLREREGWSQAQLAQRLGYDSTAAISMIETGKALPSLDKAIEMAGLFHTTVDELLGRESTARVVHYHAAGEVTVSVSNGGFVLLGGWGLQELEHLMEAFVRLRQQYEAQAADPLPEEANGGAAQ